jgi:hypothetical protein
MCLKNRKTVLRLFSNQNFSKPLVNQSFLTTNLDKTWFELKLDKDVVLSIIEVLSNATECHEFKTACLAFVNNGMVPPNLVDFWYFGNRNCKEDFKNNFMDHIQKRLKSVLDPTFQKLTPPSSDMSKARENETSFRATEKTWLMSSNEIENEGELLEYCPHIIENVENSFHSLLCQVSFDEDSWKKSNQFCLHLTVQPSGNNRDIEEKEVSAKNYSGGNDYEKLEYAAQCPGTEKANNDRFSSTAGQYLLVKRVRRDSVTNEYCKNNLAPYSHMFRIQKKGDNVGRYEGVKTVGDHVGVSPDFEDVENLFEILTVRSPCQ